MSCLNITPEIEKLAKKFPNMEEREVANLVGIWQEENGKSVEDVPSDSEFQDFIKKTRNTTTFKWARVAENSYEVSTRGDKRFSALVATFKEGTIIDGVDVSGKTIEDVYQSVIKKSRKGQAPSKDSKLYNESLKTKEEREDFSYTEGYLPLWQEWAKQNPELMDELRAKSAGKTLTDQFANTSVSQARALADILNQRNTKALSLDKYVNTEGVDKGFLTERGEELLSTSFNKKKFNKGTTKVSLYNSVSGTSIRIDFTSPVTGNSASVIYTGDPTRRTWDLFNSKGDNTTDVTSDAYWNAINKIVPKSIRDLVESGKYNEMDTTATEVDSITLATKRTALEDYFEKEYNVLIQGRSLEYNISQIKKILTTISTST